MLITRKTKIPLHWVFYAQVPFVMWIASTMIAGAPFLYTLKKFIANPAAITFLLSLEVFVTLLGTPFTNWLSDRVWTRFGRRKIFVVIGCLPQAVSLALIPFAPNLMWLLAFRWAFGIFSDLAAPNQALTMEIVPPKQRGLGSGFFQVQLNILNIVFWYLVFGRLDDIAFTGPLSGLTAASGETLVFASGAILLIASACYTFFGIHEVRPPNRVTLQQGRKPDENLAKFFVRTFFRDVLGKSLLPLYLLLLVQVLAGIDLGILGPLLYTDQWGYSKQQMGTNVAIGSAIGIFVAILAGWIADRTSKLKVYTAALIIALCCKCVWTLYVYSKPDLRPTLTEIVIFNNLQFVFVTLAAVTSFPLILDYVERNQLGTASAGMGLFSGLFRNGANMLVGFYLLVWSLLFLPQAGDRVELVFSEPISKSSLAQTLEAANYDVADYHFAPVPRSRHDDPQARHWEIRRQLKGAGKAHSELKDLNNEIDSLRLQHSSPFSEADETHRIESELASLKARRDALRQQLESSAAELLMQLKTVFANRLATDGHQILDASASPDGTKVSLTMKLVEPVAEELLRGSPEILRQLENVVDTIDIRRRYTFAPPNTSPDVVATSVNAPQTVIAFELHRDPNFVSLERTLVDAGISVDAAYHVVADLIQPIRESFGPLSKSYRIQNPTIARAKEATRLSFALQIAPSEQAVGPEQLRSLFAHLPSLRDLAISGDFPNFQLNLELSPLPDAKIAADSDAKRLAELLPDASEIRIQILRAIYERIESGISSPPYSLHTAKPVLASEPVDREYDYFLSMQIFMIVTDVLGIGVAFLIIRLEKRGLIHRRGAEEDLRRETSHS